MFQPTATFPCCERYDVVEYGNGAAYHVQEAISLMSFFLQGDDAARLKRDSRNFTDVRVLDDYLDAIGE